MSVDNSIVIYKGANGKTELQINIKKDTIWLSLDQISTVFQKNKSIISRHIKNIFETNELERNQVVANFATTAEAIKISKDEYLELIAKMKPEFGSDVFANPKDGSFDSSINQIYQTFGGEDCYPTLEEKAAMLLYMLVS